MGYAWGVYTYDQLNRLTQKTYPDSTTANYPYDNDSRLSQVSDATGAMKDTYDRGLGLILRAVATPAAFGAQPPQKPVFLFPALSL